VTDDTQERKVHLLTVLALQVHDTGTEKHRTSLSINGHGLNLVSLGDYYLSLYEHLYNKLSLPSP
jgi:hypothetical protein